MSLGFGSDPEVFISKGGKIIPAHEAGFLNGKEDFTQRETFGATSAYRDGFAAEINFPGPFGTSLELASTLAQGVAIMQEQKGIKISTVPMVEISQETLEALPADALHFGCSPSINTWTGPGLLEVDGSRHLRRYAGGHLWFSGFIGKESWTNHVDEAIKLMDLHIGLPLAYLFERPEAFERRKLYGKAGEYRLKRFSQDLLGLEYRTPGPEWMNHPMFLDFAFAAGEKILQDFDNVWEDWGDVAESEGDLIQDAINKGKDLSEWMKVLSLEGVYNEKTFSTLRNSTEIGARRFEYRLAEELGQRFDLDVKAA